MKKLLSVCLALALIMCSWALASSLLEKSKDFYYNDAANVLEYEAGQSVSSPVIGALEAAVSLKAGMLVCCASMALTSLFCLADRRAERPGQGTHSGQMRLHSYSGPENGRTYKTPRPRPGKRTRIWQNSD